MSKITNLIKTNLSFIIGFIIIFVFVSYISTSLRGTQLTNQFFDPIRTTHNREEVAIIGIDDKSLQTIGAWPFDRKVFADLTKKLSDTSVKAVVYDILFLETRSGDNLFKEVLASTQSKIILGSKLENNSYLSSYLISPSNLLVSSAIANVKPDSDTKVRKYPIGFMNKDECVYPLAESAFNFFTFVKENNCQKKDEGMFRYPTKIATYSLSDILSGKIPSDKLKNKVIFVGSTSLDLMDHFAGMNGEKIPGVFVHASIFTSLLNKVSDRNTNNTETLFLILIYILITAIFIFKAKSLSLQIGTILLAGISVIILSLIAFSYGIILPTPWLLVTIFITGGYITLYRFIKEQKQNQYIQSLFSKYVHKDVLKELMRSSSSLNFAGEKREMTILFSDIRGFTTLSESLEPEELTKILNGYLSAMTPSILEEKGTIDKFIGDAIMAFWNAPLFVENHPTHAVRSALKMEKALGIFNKENNTSLAIGIGIHLGNVIVGNVGSSERVNYTVLGDAVNLASRLEGLTKKYGIMCVVSEDVKTKVIDDSIIFRKLDIITVKGKSLPTTLYEVKEKNDSIVQIFSEYEKAFNYYQKGNFNEAEMIFKKLSDNGDKPSKAMLERLPIVREQNSWDGVWHFDEK